MHRAGHRRRPRVAVQHLEERRQEIGGDLGVVVEQQDRARAGLERGADAGVVAAGVAAVLRERHDPLACGKRARTASTEPSREPLSTTQTVAPPSSARREARRGRRA